LLLTVTYTALGGLKAVVVTETIQIFLLIGSAILVTILSIAHLPSLGIHDLAAFREARSQSNRGRGAQKAV
jgi:SSS family solute:Na+ symporter